MECVLCKNAFTSKLKLVQHFRETHSVAKHRPRRSRVVEEVRRICVKDSDECDEGEGESNQVNNEQSVRCGDCEKDFSSQSSFDIHTCSILNLHQSKLSVSCIYCGQKCKNRRGATIHQVFCEQRNAGTGLKLIHYSCPSNDCGAIFKNEQQLLRHMKNHHTEENVTIIRSSTFTSDNLGKINDNENVEMPSAQHKAKSPMVTVTMKPHVGKTDGLQDLSLLITPSKGSEEGSEIDTQDSEDIVSQSPSKESTSITVEECLILEEGRKGDHQTVLCVSEDGSISESPADVETEKTFLLLTEDNYLNDKCIRSYDCEFCSQSFLQKDSLNWHINKNHKAKGRSERVKVRQEVDDLKVKQEVDDNFNRGTKRKDEDEDWEFVDFKSDKVDSEMSMWKGKYEYVCKLCDRSFMSELSFQSHMRNADCRTKKFKLPRMFACHFSRCDSSFFKLSELQKHWHIAHKYTMASRTCEFEDEKSFLNWVSEEESKNKVRFTCDVRRRKPRRSERLMVCHRFHALRTAAARKAANREYSEKHNWVHKIQPCLCYARMKVYQDYDKKTSDYTGKISVVYYYEHSHPENKVLEDREGILDHVLERNRRNRASLFQELKGSEKVQHRQKLEKFAKIAGKEYRSLTRSSKIPGTRRQRRETGIVKTCVVKNESLPCVQLSANLLETDELFNPPVEMVLDGHFDMSHEVFGGDAATHLDSVVMFDGNKLKETYIDNTESEIVLIQDDNDSDKESDDSTVMLPASTDDWAKLFKYARLRCESSGEIGLKSEASLVLPYEKVIGLISPSDQIPIFQQLWKLAQPALNSEDVIQVMKIDVVSP